MQFPPIFLLNKFDADLEIFNDTISNHASMVPTDGVPHAPSMIIISSRHIVNASAILEMEQRHHIQIMAASTAAFSIVATLVALYWFSMMRRNFRRNLVLLLVLGDFWKSLWYLAYSSRMFIFVTEPITTDSDLCQVTGYFLQQGLESCDFAIFFMSLHMYLQIFPLRGSRLGANGLYRIRNWVVAAWFVIPNLMAALPYVASDHGYEVTGAFCWLPIRPYWYRLALSWIPRYLIWISVMGVAIRIYTHVGAEFKLFGYERDSSSTLALPGRHIPRASADANMISAWRHPTALEEGQDSLEGTSPNGISRPANGAMPSLQPEPLTNSVFNMFAPPPRTSTSYRSNIHSQRGCCTSAAGIIEGIATSTKPSSSSLVRSMPPSHAPASHTSRIESRKASSAVSSTAQHTAAKGMQLRRDAIQRQLRLLFIYPVIYVLIWIIPFVYHSMNYSNYYAQHPIYVLAFLNTFCQCMLGAADVAVFCWREKPWRHIPGSSGTFTGSFMFWRFCFRREWINEVRWGSNKPRDMLAEDAEEMEYVSRSWIVPGIKEEEPSQEPSQKPTTSSVLELLWRQQDSTREVSPGKARPDTIHWRHGKDLEAEYAYQRLAMERADYETGLKIMAKGQTRYSQKPSHREPSPPTSRRKEWWDSHLAYATEDDDKPEVDDELSNECTSNK